MKKLLYLLSIVLLISSCMKKPDYNSYTVELQVDLTDEITAEDIENSKITFNNLQKGYSIVAEMNSSGIIIFPMLEPGFYSATLSKSFVRETKKYNLNGMIELEVFSSIKSKLPVVLSTSSALVIKEFYYSGSLTPAGKAYYSDQYIEIYNNSEEMLYVDGISIVEHESYATGTNFWTNMSDKTVVKMIWTIPGNGEDYPLYPGTSIILAKDPLDHKDDPNGNPNSPVNLGNADFEFWVYMAAGYDIDMPNSPNLIEDLFTYRGSDVAFHVKGGSAIAIAKIALDPDERTDYINNNLVRKDNYSTRWYCAIDNEMVIDAVEVVFDEGHAVYKRFPLELDAGYTYVPAGSKSGKCIRRKIKTIIDGRIVYQDTNNSTEDFIKDSDPKPWIYE